MKKNKAGQHEGAEIKGLSGDLLPKCKTGIEGLDTITNGGLPRGRTSLICGSSGSGKTLLAMEFLVRGLGLEVPEHGVFLAFEETVQELTQNFASVGFDLTDMTANNQIEVDHIHVDRSGLDPAGEFDLGGLFIRIDAAIIKVGATRVVLDSLETLFSGYSNQGILRLELRRLFSHLKDQGVTTVVTAEQGEGTLTRFGLEEYVADCVIFLDHKLHEQIATRRLRVVKYRGSAHGTNEYPFLIDERGLSIIPITSLSLSHDVSVERISSGVESLDAMMGGLGYYRGTSILVTGTAGSGKSTLSAHFIDAACRRNEKCLYFAFEESATQIMRNMKSVGIDLEAWVSKGLLRFRNTRSTVHGLEMHLVDMHKEIEKFNPQVVVADPISDLLVSARQAEVMSMLSRLIDYLKGRQITALFTDLTAVGGSLEKTEVGVSPLMDTWILVQIMEGSGERNRGLYILKSRGMDHSNQIREFILSGQGIALEKPYIGAGRVLTGSARVSQAALEKADALVLTEAMQRKEREIRRNQEKADAQIAAIKAEFEAERKELELAIRNEVTRKAILASDAEYMGDRREGSRPDR
jgi:circadian clock protein KaiC